MCVAYKSELFDYADFDQTQNAYHHFVIWFGISCISTVVVMQNLIIYLIKSATVYHNLYQFCFVKQVFLNNTYINSLTILF